MPIAIALVYVFVLGFLTAGVHQAWGEVLSFSLGGNVVGFSSFCLALVFLGLGAGGYWGYRYCKARRLDMIRFVVKASFLACIFTYILTPLYSNFLVLLPFLGFLFWVPIYAIIFGAVGFVLPITAHQIRRSPWLSVGRTVGWMFGIFLLGAAAAPWFIRLLALDAYEPPHVLRGLAVGFGVLPLLFFKQIDFKQAAERKGLVQLGAVSVVLLALLAFVDTQTSEKLFFKDVFHGQRGFVQHIKSAHGALVGINGAEDVGEFYRQGSYEGRFSFNPLDRQNRIERAYFISSLHPDPEEVLQLGLGNGAWAAVFAGNPSTTAVTVVEPHPYIKKIVDRYSEIKPILHDEKVNLVRGDGRRWLHQNKGKKFDLIVVNNNAAHEDHLTRHLSDDFIQLAKRHLKEGGMLAINTAGCSSILRTVAEAFPYITVVDETVLGAFSTPVIDDDIIRTRLESFRPNGNVVFDSMETVTRAALDELAKAEKNNERDFYVQVGTVGSDNNLWCEYKEHLYIRQLTGKQDFLVTELPTKDRPVKKSATADE